MHDSCSVKSECTTNQMEAIEQYFHVVLFIMLYKVVLIFKGRRILADFLSRNCRFFVGVNWAKISRGISLPHTSRFFVATNLA